MFLPDKYKSTPFKQIKDAILKLITLLCVILVQISISAPQLSNENIITNDTDTTLRVKIALSSDPSGLLVPNLNLGDRLNLAFVTSEDAYVYIFSVDAGGSVEQIFPYKLSKSNYLSANIIVNFPDKEDYFTFNIAPPFGVSKIVALASRYPLDLSSVSKNTGEVFNKVMVGGQSGLAEALKKLLLRQDSKAWNVSTIKYNIVKKEQPGNLAVAPKPTFAQLKLTSSQSGIKLFQGTTPIGSLPLELNNLAPGPYSFTLESGDMIQTLELNLEPGEIFTRNITFVRGGLSLSSNPTGAQVSQSGKVIGVTPLRLVNQLTGFQQYTLSFPDYLAQTIVVDLKQGETLIRDITLLPVPAPGGLTLSSSPSGAQVLLAGKTLGMTPLKLENQTAGSRDYTFSLPKYKPLTRTLEVVSGKVLEQSVALERLPTVLQVQLEPGVNNAVLKVDGQNKGFVREGRTTLELDPSKTSVEVQIIAPGFASFTRMIKLEPSDTNNFKVVLEARENVKLPPVSAPLALPVSPVPPVPVVSPQTVPLPNVKPTSSLTLPALPPRSDVYALVMGVSQYSLDVPPLAYAASDAQNFSSLLTNPRGGNLVSRNVVTLLNRDARRTRIENALRGFGPLRSSDTLIVYFSGHGTTSKAGKPLLAPFEADPLSLDTLQESTLALEDLQSQASATGAGRMLFIIDACYSGAQGSRSFNAEGSKPIGVIQTPHSSERLSVFSASSAQQPSYESATLKAGYFTATLLEGLSGSADRNGDGKITLEELSAYTGVRVTQAVQRERSATQTPELTGSADFALVVQPVALTLEQRRKKLGELRRVGKISPEQLDTLLILLDRNELPGDVNEYLMGKLEEDRFLRRLNSGAIEGIPTP